MAVNPFKTLPFYSNLVSFLACTTRPCVSKGPLYATVKKLASLYKT